MKENPITMNGFYARLFLLCQTAETNAVVELKKEKPDSVRVKEILSEFEKLSAARCFVLQASQINAFPPDTSSEEFKKIPLPSEEHLKNVLDGLRILLEIKKEFVVKGNSIYVPVVTNVQHDFLKATLSPFGYRLM